MSEEEIGLIVMILHVGNGRCMEVGVIWGLGRAVGTNVGFRSGWQQWGHWCSYSHCLSLVRHVYGRVINAQRGIAVVVAIGCQWPDLHHVLPLIPSLLIMHPAIVLHVLQPCPTLYHIPPSSIDLCHHPHHHHHCPVCCHCHYHLSH